MRVECVNKTLLPYTMDVGAAWAPYAAHPHARIPWGSIPRLTNRPLCLSRGSGSIPLSCIRAADRRLCLSRSRCYSRVRLCVSPTCRNDRPHYPTTEMYFNFTAAVGASAAHLTAISGKLLAVKEGEGAAAQLAFREVYFFDPKVRFRSHGSPSADPLALRTLHPPACMTHPSHPPPF